MEEKIEIPISESQRKLLHETVKGDIMDEDIDRAISAVVSKEGKNYIYLDPLELEDLIGTICFISNHEKNNNKLVRQLENLADYLEKYLDE
ncbi:MAG: hypothetical protein ABIG61_13310 [Planctomycetota bacterium]